MAAHRRQSAPRRGRPRAAVVALVAALLSAAPIAVAAPASAQVEAIHTWQVELETGLFGYPPLLNISYVASTTAANVTVSRLPMWTDVVARVDGVFPAVGPGGLTVAPFEIHAARLWMLPFAVGTISFFSPASGGNVNQLFFPSFTSDATGFTISGGMLAVTGGNGPQPTLGWGTLTLTVRQLT